MDTDYRDFGHQYISGSVVSCFLLLFMKLLTVPKKRGRGGFIKDLN
jgi:hypothetical protein